VSLTRVNDTEGSGPNACSNFDAVVAPANPPPRMTIRVAGVGRRSTGSGSGRQVTSVASACIRTPATPPATTQPTSDGKSDRMPVAVHWGG
jgi:hypothetical protein